MGSICVSTENDLFLQAKNIFIDFICKKHNQKTLQNGNFVQKLHNRLFKHNDVM